LIRPVGCGLGRGRGSKRARQPKRVKSSKHTTCNDGEGARPAGRARSAGSCVRGGRTSHKCGAAARWEENDHRYREGAPDSIPSRCDGVHFGAARMAGYRVKMRCVNVCGRHGRGGPVPDVQLFGPRGAGVYSRPPGGGGTGRTGDPPSGQRRRPPLDNPPAPRATRTGLGGLGRVPVAVPSRSSVTALVAGRGSVLG
jgi:hypothetical protein